MSGQRRLIVTTDIKGYTGRDEPDAEAAQHRLVAVLRAAYAHAHLELDPDPARRLLGPLPSQPEGDATLDLLPPGVPEAETVAAFVFGLLYALDADNRGRLDAWRLRLRTAIGQGVPEAPGANGFGGLVVPAVVDLCNADATRRALVEAPAADLVVVLDDEVHASSVRGAALRGCTGSGSPRSTCRPSTTGPPDADGCACPAHRPHRPHPPRGGSAPATRCSPTARSRGPPAPSSWPWAPPAAPRRRPGRAAARAPAPPRRTRSARS